MHRSVQDPVVEDIKAMLGEFGDYEVRHVRREANEVAHRLAKDGSENKVCKTWVLPPCMGRTW